MRCAHVDRRGRQCKRGAHASGMHVYAGLNATGAKTRRERRALDRARNDVRDRSRGYCEGRVAVNCTGVGVAAHHVWPEDRDAGRHEAKRMRWLCAPCHAWVHNFPDNAKRLGLLRATQAVT